MYFLLSPAKSLNETDAIPVNLGNYYSQPELIAHSQSLMKVLKSKEPVDLQELMSISDDLAQLNATRNQQWHWSEDKPFTDDESGNAAKPAGYLFDGDVYTGLDMYHMDKETAVYVNEHLGILSGLYGVLKPLDLIQPAGTRRCEVDLVARMPQKPADHLRHLVGPVVVHDEMHRAARGQLRIETIQERQ